MDEENEQMGLTASELITLVPEAEALVKALTEALKKDVDGKVHITKEEGKRIKELAAKIALHLAKDIID